MPGGTKLWYGKGDVLDYLVDSKPGAIIIDNSKRKAKYVRSNNNRAIRLKVQKPVTG
jgi:hypothetical protein